MDRQTWTELDDRDYQRVATRVRLGWLDEVPQTRYREPRHRVAGMRVDTLEPADEEPSRKTDTRLRSVNIPVSCVLGGVCVVLVVATVAAFRLLFG